MKRKRKETGAVPILAGRQQQLPAFARMPKPGASHAGLFRKVQNATPIAVRGAPLALMGLDDEGASKNSRTTVGFRTRMDIPLPPEVMAKHKIIKASIIAQGSDALGANELRVYLAVLGLAAAGISDASAGVVDPTMNSERANDRREKLGVRPGRNVHPVLRDGVPGLAGALSHPHIVVLKKSISAIAGAAGLQKGVDGRKAVIAGLRALEAVTMKMVLVFEGEDGKKIVKEQSDLSLRLLTAKLTTSEDLDENESPVKSDKRIRNFAEICFDPVVTDIIRHAEGVRYDLISLEDVRSLSDIALLLYNRLSVKLKANRPLTFKADTLVEYVYEIPDRPDPGDGDKLKHWEATLRKYRHRVRKGLEEIHEKLHWEILGIGNTKGSRTASSIYRISRPHATDLNPGFSFYEVASQALLFSDVEIGPEDESLFPKGSEDSQ